MPRLHTQSCSLRENAINAMANHKAPRNNCSYPSIKHDVVIRAKNDYVAWNVGAKVWRAKRSQMMPLCVEMFRGEHYRFSTDLTYSPISLLQFNYQ
jgi:hypothetical protein